MRSYCVALAVVAACALPSAGEFAVRTADTGGDASDGGPVTLVNDAGTTTKDAAPTIIVPTDAGEDAAPPPEPVVTNLLSKNLSDFEGGDCKDYSGHYESTIAGSNVAHGGSLSCNVCRLAGSTDELWSIDNDVAPISPQVGQEYRAFAWVRRAPGSSDPIYAHIALRSEANDSSAIELGDSPGLLLTDSWQKVNTSLTLTKPAKRIDTYTYADNNAGLANPCFLIDDYVVYLVE